MSIEEQYKNGTYLEHNPGWHCADAPWKIGNVISLLNAHEIRPATVCEVGCGSGENLRCFRREMPETHFFGYDISPQAADFWGGDSREIVFKQGDFNEIDTSVYDVLLMLDVFEHVRDPFTFLEGAKSHAKKFVFHIPLDLSASSVVRRRPLLDVRRKVGHLHYYTKDLALEMLADCGYKVVEWQYTGASLNSPQRSLRTRVAGYLRRLAYFFNKDWGVRLLGGETLIVLAE